VDKKFVMAMDDAIAPCPSQRIFPWARERGRLGGKLWGCPSASNSASVVNKGVSTRWASRPCPRRGGAFLTSPTIKSAVSTHEHLLIPHQPRHYFSISLHGSVRKDGFEDLLWRTKVEGHAGVIQAAQNLVDFVKQGWIPQTCAPLPTM